MLLTYRCLSLCYLSRCCHSLRRISHTGRQVHSGCSCHTPAVISLLLCMSHNGANRAPYLVALLSSQQQQAMQGRTTEVQSLSRFSRESQSPGRHSQSTRGGHRQNWRTRQREAAETCNRTCFCQATGSTEAFRGLWRLGLVSRRRRHRCHHGFRAECAPRAANRSTSTPTAVIKPQTCSRFTQFVLTSSDRFWSVEMRSFYFPSVVCNTLGF